MPFFKTTYNIFKDNGEYFDPNWMDSDKLILPPREFWDYQREMTIEDVDIWEQISIWHGFEVYAAWSPYAEFYIIKKPFDIQNPEIFYGKKASERVYLRAKELNIPITKNTIWVEDEDMWLYA